MMLDEDGVAIVRHVALPHFRRAEHIMGMPAATKKRWTADEARALNEANPLPFPYYEVVDGELLVSPAPRSLHQDAVLLLARLLAAYMERTRVGHVMIGPADISLEPDSLLSPDVFVTRLVDGRKPRSWNEVRGLWLVAEVLSPSTARYDRVVKRGYFGRNAVPEYWVVDLDARLIERWHPGEERPDVVTGSLRWTADAAVDGFSLNVVSFFRDVHGGDG